MAVPTSFLIKRLKLWNVPIYSFNYFPNRDTPFPSLEPFSMVKQVKQFASIAPKDSKISIKEDFHTANTIYQNCPPLVASFGMSSNSVIRDSGNNVVKEEATWDYGPRAYEGDSPILIYEKTSQTATGWCCRTLRVPTNAASKNIEVAGTKPHQEAFAPTALEMGELSTIAHRVKKNNRKAPKPLRYTPYHR